MSRTPYDTFSKDLTAAALAPLGEARSDARLASDPQYADLRFEARPGITTPRTDLFARMGVERALFEFSREAPDLAEMASWQRKQLSWFQALLNEARRDRTPPPALPPVSWGLSSGPPTQAMRAYALASMGAPWPRGCYQGAPAGTFRLVVISELPRTRDTLLVRALGKGTTFRRAVAELEALPPEAPERTLIAVPLLQLQLQLRDDSSDEAKEILMQTQKLAQEMLQQQFDRGVEKAVVSLRESIALVAANRGLELGAAHRARLDAERRIEVLQAWLTAALTAERAADIFVEPTR